MLGLTFVITNDCILYITQTARNLGKVTNKRVFPPVTKILVTTLLYYFFLAP